MRKKFYKLCISVLSLFFSTAQLYAQPKLDTNLSRAIIIDVLIGGSGSYSYGRNYEISNTIFLKDYQTYHLGILYTVKGDGFISGDSLEFSSKFEGNDDEWSLRPTIFQNGEVRGEFFDSLTPGKYTFIVRVRKQGEEWRKRDAQLIINISLPFWQIWWFWLSVIAGVALIVFAIIKWRVNAARKQERLKAKHEKELLELKAQALSAQMNPHFIFNCMNSIKSLMQKNDHEKGVIYQVEFIPCFFTPNLLVLWINCNHKGNLCEGATH
jgi:hypothetical protein